MNSWLTAAKNAFAGRALNFRVCMLLRGEVTQDVVFLLGVVSCNKPKGYYYGTAVWSVWSCLARGQFKYFKPLVVHFSPFLIVSKSSTPMLFSFLLEVQLCYAKVLNVGDFFYSGRMVLWLTRSVSTLRIKLISRNGLFLMDLLTPCGLRAWIQF